MKKKALTLVCIFISLSILSQTFSIQWQKSLGGPLVDAGMDIQATTDGGFVLTASSESSTGDASWNYGMKDYWVVKLDYFGTIEWEKSYGGNNDDIPSSILQTMDGGFIVSGYSASNDGNVTDNNGNTDFWVLKLDSLGNIEWQKTFGSSGVDYGRTINKQVMEDIL